MEIKKNSKNKYYIDNGVNGRLDICPCCGLSFETEHAAELVAKAIETGEVSWNTALDLQQVQEEP